MLQDAHIHIQDAGPEGEKILRGAARNGVGRFFCNGATPSDWEAVKSLSRSCDGVVPFFGVHPWYIDEAVPDWEKTLAGYLSDTAARIGEIGLDRAKRGISFERQLEVFRTQLDIASEMQRPFTVHCVQAWDALLQELHRRVPRAGHKTPFIIHWFSGSPEVAGDLVKLGAYISFSPRLIDAVGGKQEESFRQVPADRILLETDYPYMPGAPSGVMTDAQSYFSTLHSLYKGAAALKGMREDEFTRRVWDNGTVFVY